MPSRHVRREEEGAQEKVERRQQSEGSEVKSGMGWMGQFQWGGP